MSILRSTRTSQPQQPVGIDWSNPITRGLRFAVVPSNNGGTVDLVSAQRLSFVGQPGLRSGTRGVARTFATSSGLTIDSQRDIATSAPLTLMAVAYINATGITHNLIDIANTANADWYQQLAVNGSQQISMRTRQAAIDIADTTAAVSVGVPFVAFGVTASSANRFAVLNGVSGAVGTTSLAPTSLTRCGVGVLRRNGSDADFMNGGVYLAAAWDRALSQSEIALLTANPWQLFAPDRRIWAPVSASGPVTHDGAGTLGNAGAAVGGSATHVGNHAASGALSGAGGVVTGASARTRQHPASGVLVNPGGVIVGAATRSAPGVHDATGALRGPAAVIAGSATHFGNHPSSGVLSGQGAIVVGSALRTPAPVTHSASGSLGNPGAVLVGVAINETNAPPIVNVSGGFPQEDKRRKKYEEERQKRWASYQPKPKPKLEPKKDEIEEAKRALFKAKLEADQAKKDAELASQELLSRTIIKKARESAAIAAKRVDKINREIAELERQEAQRIEEEDILYIIRKLASM